MDTSHVIAHRLSMKRKMMITKEVQEDHNRKEDTMRSNAITVENMVILE